MLQKRILSRVEDGETLMAHLEGSLLPNYTLLLQRSVFLVPWEETEDYTHNNHGDPSES
jgi:hypothetical protein